MPVSPADADRLAREVAGVYEDLETQLVGMVSRRLASGSDAPTWVEDKLDAVGKLRDEARRAILQVDDAAPDLTSAAVRKAYTDAAASAVRDLTPDTRDAAQVRRVLPNTRQLDRLVADTVLNLRAAHEAALRTTVDVYRTALSRTAGSVLAGVDTRRQATQRAVHALTRDGITGFTDRAGREWALTSYAEMAMRTATGRAAVDGHLDQLRSMGHELVYVSDHAQECEICRPWEGQILTLAGEARTVTVGQQTVTPTATVDTARAAGLFHPNCRHRLYAYIPGASRPTASPDPEAYEARMRQRALERRVRRGKMRLAAATDPATRARARLLLRRSQAALGAHIGRHQLKRLPYREGIGAGNLPPRGRPGRGGQPAGGAPGLGPRPDLGRSVARSSPYSAGALRGASLDDLDELLVRAAGEGNDAAVDAIAAEMDRRSDPGATMGRTWDAPDQGIPVDAATELAEAAAVDHALGPVPGGKALSWEEYEALEFKRLGDQFDGQAAYDRWERLYPQKAALDRAQLADRAARDQGAGTVKMTRDEQRQAYHEHVVLQYERAARETDGWMVRREFMSQGIDPFGFFDGTYNAAQVRKYASEDLLRWFGEGGSNQRLTFTRYQGEVLGYAGALRKTADQRSAYLSEFDLR